VTNLAIPGPWSPHIGANADSPSPRRLNARAHRRIVGYMVVGALAGVALALALVAWWSMRLTLRVRDGVHGDLARVSAHLAVGIGAVAAFSGALLLDGIVTGVVVPAGACAAGFALAAFTADGGDDGGEGGRGGDDDPPWWPSFERELRRYDRRRVHS
jgi:hypothetical protein